MKNRPFKIATLALLALSACINIPPLDCTKDADCTTKTIAGVCVFAEGLPGACGLPDESCSSGYRYYKDSSGGRSNQCALLPSFEIQLTKTEVKEHDIFSVHAIAKDSSGQKFTQYKGAPTLSSNWGDVRIFSSSGFVNGEADYTLWLNRETSSTHGLAQLSLQDGPNIGRSSSITVLAPYWSAMPLQEINPPLKTSIC